MEVNVSDRFSGLPQHILHHILSFLSAKDVITTGTLSKTFLSVFKSFAFLDFDFHDLSRMMTADEFLNYVNARCSQYDGTHVLQKFRLHSLEPLPDDDRLDRAVNFAVENEVRDLTIYLFPEHALYINVRVRRLPIINFPKFVTKLCLCGFKIENINELIRGCPLIEVLELSNCGLQGKDFHLSSSVIKSIRISRNVGLKGFQIVAPSLEAFHFVSGPSLCDPRNKNICRFLNLKDLVLNSAPITDRWIKHVIPHLALLETISIAFCDELRNFQVSNSSLKRIDLSVLRRLEVIEVAAINLESFRYYGSSENGRTISINISACKHLKNLDVGGEGIPEEFLQSKISTFLELEELCLFMSSFIERVEINLGRLRSLSIMYSTGANIYINTPRLVSLFYRGGLDSSISISNPVTTLDTTLYIIPEIHQDAMYFQKLLLFLQCLGPCKAVTIQGCHIRDLIFPEEMRKRYCVPLVNLRLMIIELNESEIVTAELVDSLLWLSPYLHTLVFRSSLSIRPLLSIKFHYETTMNKDFSLISRSCIPVENEKLIAVEMEEFGGVDETDNLLKYFKGKAKSINLKWSSSANIEVAA